MEKLLESILSRMKSKGLIDEHEEDVYRFGLECLLLKAIHYSSYIVISVMLQMTIPMLMSAVVLMPLRRKSGGFHARTRVECYLFSCTIVFVVCLLNKIVLPLWLFIVTMFLSNVIVVAFAPVENENRLLDQTERKIFRKQTLIVLMMADVAIITSGIAGWVVCQWLLNGVVIAAQLTLIGKLQKNCNKKSNFYKGK